MKKIIQYIKQVGATGWLYLLLSIMSPFILENGAWFASGIFLGVFIEKNVNAIEAIIKSKL